MKGLRVTPELLNTLPIPPPEEGTDKDGRGKALVGGGSVMSIGAVTLAGMSAFRAGAGKVLLAVPRSLSLHVAAGFPEAGVHGFTDNADGDPVPRSAAAQIASLLANVDAGLIGPGLAEESRAQDLARRILDTVVGPCFVLDASALTGLWDSQKILAKHPGKLVITPHAGEMASLSGVSKEQVLADPTRIAQEVATRLECIVVLKGATTAIAQPDGPLYLHEGGVVGLATSGSGDVLAGILTGLLARGATPLQASLWSVFLHAQAGRRLSQRIGPVGFLARELPAEIPALMSSITAFEPR